MLNRDVYDELIAVKDEDATAMALAPGEGRRAARRHLGGLQRPRRVAGRDEARARASESSPYCRTPASVI